MDTLKIGQKVIIDIKIPESYTSDLFSSINGKNGIIIQKQGKHSCYDNAYLIEFDLNTTRKYAKTHNGQWGGRNYNDPSLKPMAWWTERKNFILSK